MVKPQCCLGFCSLLKPLQHNACINDDLIDHAHYSFLPSQVSSIRLSKFFAQHAEHRLMFGNRACPRIGMAANIGIFQLSIENSLKPTPITAA